MATTTQGWGMSKSKQVMVKTNFTEHIMQHPVLFQSLVKFHDQNFCLLSSSKYEAQHGDAFTLNMYLKICPAARKKQILYEKPFLPSTTQLPQGSSLCWNIVVEVGIYIQLLWHSCSPQQFPTAGGHVLWKLGLGLSSIWKNFFVAYWHNIQCEIYGKNTECMRSEVF